MKDYLVLCDPACLRIYGDSVEAFLTSEAETLLGCDASLISLCGTSYLALSAEGPRELMRLSPALAVFQREGELLRPIDAHTPHGLPRSITSMLKYPGKTNELFTRAMVNIADGLRRTKAPRPLLLDPMCGSGTTLFDAASLGVDAVGIDLSAQSTARGAVFFEKYLQTGRYKHKKRSSSHKKIASVMDFEYAVTKEEWDGGNPRRLRFMCGDTAEACGLLAKNSVDMLICDLPYGVQHGSTAQTGLCRDACALVSQAMPSWVSVLKKGGSIVLAFNAFTTRSDRLCAMLERAGFEVCADLSGGAMLHRVDQAINRDIVAAVRK